MGSGARVESRRVVSAGKVIRSPATSIAGVSGMPAGRTAASAACHGPALVTGVR